MAIRGRGISRLYELPNITTGVVLPPCLSIVVPVDRDVANMIDNPSFETGTTNWAGSGCGGITRVLTNQYFGTYSLQVTCGTPPSSPRGAFYGITNPLSLTSGTQYVASLYFLCPVANLEYDLYVATTLGVRLSGRKFRSTGFWQRVWVPYKETSTTTRRLYIESSTLSSAGPNDTNKNFWIDGVQFEEVPSGEPAFPTTYIDGDQFGFTPNEFPKPYYWNGTPHGSTSVRGQLTRSGGKVVNLRDLGLTLSVVAGLGLAIPAHSSLAFSQIDGEVLQVTQKQPRVFTIGGRVTQPNQVMLDDALTALASEMDADSGPRREPLLFKYQPMDDEENQTGSEVDIIATYNGGLEGQRDNPHSEVFTATYKQYLPVVLGHTGGVALTNSSSVSNANSAVRRKSDGTWTAIGGTGFSGGLARITALARHPDGTVYWGGDFTDAGGSGADYAAKYNPITDALSVVKGATSFNAAVEVITIGPDGIVYFGGGFTNVDGIAAADGIVAYNPTTNTFSALGTGVAAGGSVFAIAFDGNGHLWAGGSFATMGGVANTVNIARWDGAAWNAVGTGTNGLVRTILPIQGSTDVFLGGDFTLAGGVANTIRIARWTGSAYVALETGGADAAVRHIVKSPSGLIYVVGVFTTLGGRSIEFIGTWNGFSFQAIPGTPDFNDSIQGIAFKPNGTFYVVGEFGSVDGVTYPDAVAEWDGSGFVPLGVDLPGVAPVFDIIAPDDGSLYIGYNAAGSASVEAVTTLEHSGTGNTYPVIRMQGPSSGTARLFSIRNISTGKSLYFNLTLLTGETAILNLDPSNPSFISDFRGDLSFTIMMGSDDSDFFLKRGTNRLAMINSGSPTMTMWWREAFTSVYDATGVQ